MNRNISFRAFHQPTKRYFNVASLSADTVIPFALEGLTQYELEHSFRVQKFPLVECVLLQSTGLCDKGGHQIWEGDILRDDVYYDADQQSKGEVDYSSYCQVLFDKGGFILKYLADDDTQLISEYLSKGRVQLTRVSNPFEHPELLELTKAEYPVAVPSPYNKSGGPQHVEPKIVPLNSRLDFRVYHKPTKNFFVGITLTHEGIQVTNEENETLPDLPFDDCVMLPFTGAIDSTGRKIYQGDVYLRLYMANEVDAAFVEVVNCIGCAFGFQTTATSEFFPFCEPGMDTTDPCYAYLGNIYTYPELATVKEYDDVIETLAAIHVAMSGDMSPVISSLYPFTPARLLQYAKDFKKGENNQSSNSSQQAA